MIFVVVAMPSEAKPFCKRYGLKLRCEKPFTIFQKDEIALIISGIGIESSAAAVGYLGGLFNRHQKDLWLNIGIAGHQTLGIGSLVMAHKVSRWDDGRHWFPDFTARAPLPTVEIVSFNKTVNDFTGDYVCDMESAGFMAAAEKFSPSHLTHAIKIISDNEESGVLHIDRKFVSTLIGESLESIACAIEFIKDSGNHLAISSIPEEQELMQCMWQFTASQSAQLAEELRRFSALTGGRRVTLENLKHCRTAQEVIRIIRAMANSNTPELDF